MSPLHHSSLVYDAKYTDSSDIMSTDESETDDGSDEINVNKLFKFSIPYQDYITMKPIEIKYGEK